MTHYVVKTCLKQLSFDNLSFIKNLRVKDNCVIILFRFNKKYIRDGQPILILMKDMEVLNL